MDENANVVLDAIDAVARRDAERLFELYADDVEFHEAPSLPYGGTVRGKARLRAQLAATPQQTWIGTWAALQPSPSDRRMDPRIVAFHGNEVVALFRQRAVSRRGERFDWPVLALYQVRDRKLRRAQMFHFDTVAVRAFLARADAADD